MFRPGVTLRIAHLVTENARALVDLECVAEEIEFSVKNVVAENERGAGAAEKLVAD